MEANSLDELIEKEGVEVTEKNYRENTNRFAYDTTSPIPGQNTDIVTDIDNITEDTALDALVVKSAMAKARAEKKENTITPAQMRAAKKQIVDMLMYNEGEAYYQKYHYIMDGKTKRKVRRMLEKNFDKGKYNHFFTTNNLNEP